MRRSITVCVIGLVFILAIPSTLFTLEYNWVTNVCRNANTRVEDVQEAKNAVRNYRGPLPFPSMMSKLRQIELFQSDGFGENGGWWVEKWTRFMFIHRYSVGFQLSNPDFEIICDVFECGAVENCMTVGAYAFMN